MTKRLLVQMNDQLVGELLQLITGELQFSYDSNWLANAKHPISLSLPLREEPFKHAECRAYFAGLLPEEHQRKVIAENLQITARNDFKLLSKIGGECAGALRLISPELAQSIPAPEYQPLNEAQLSELITNLPKRPLLAGEFGVRLSLAGAQTKMALLLQKDQYFLPLNGAPSSHIIKPTISGFDDSVRNELLCMTLAKKIGIPTSTVHAEQIADQKFLVVERYDRINVQGKLQRLHQEDFCQALGIAPEYKYQNEGGPTLADCFSLVRRHSALPLIDLRNLLDTVMFNFIIGNNDAHGKNFSLLYTDQGIRLTPMYDLLSTMRYPDLSHKMAMKIGGKYSIDDITLHQWEKLASEIDFSAALVKRRLHDLIETTQKALGEMAEEFPGDPMLEFLSGYISKRQRAVDR